MDYEFIMPSKVIARLKGLSEVPEVLVRGTFEVEKVVQYNTPLGTSFAHAISSAHLESAHLDTGDDVTELLLKHGRQEFMRHVAKIEDEILLEGY